MGRQLLPSEAFDGNGNLSAYPVGPLEDVLREAVRLAPLADCQMWVFHIGGYLFGAATAAARGHPVACWTVGNVCLDQEVVFWLQPNCGGRSMMERD